MKNLFRYITILYSIAILLVASSCKQGSDTPEPNGNTPHTLLFYFVGTDLNYFFGVNLNSTKAALSELSAPGGALSGKGAKPRVIYFRQINKTEAKIAEIIYNKGDVTEQELAVYQLPAEMTSEQMGQYLSDMIEFAPAENYGLVIGSHSRGWTPKNGVDFYQLLSTGGAPYKWTYWERDPDALVTRFLGEGYPFFSSYNAGNSNMFDIPELASALSSTGKKFKYIIYDACFMANIESLYDLRHCSEYAIASVSEIMGSGFPYAAVVPHLLQYRGKEFDLESVCYEYTKYYKEDSNTSGSISLVDCSELEALAASTRSVNLGAQKSVNNNSLQYYEGLNPHLYFDFGQYINLLCADESIKAEFNAQLAKAVPYKNTLSSFYTALKPGRGTHYINTNVYSGLTTSQSSEMYRTEYAETAWYKATH